MNKEEALVTTTKGNLPRKDLEYKTEWVHVPDKYIKLYERYYLDGEVVRESVHVYLFKGLNTNSETGL